MRRDMKPMLARLVRELPTEGYVYEPKWDGFRCLALRDGDKAELSSRHERPLARYFPELTAAVCRLEPRRFVVDGEVLVVIDGRFDFEALMGRLHPSASRVRELAGRSPALFVAFDLIRLGDEDLADQPFVERRRKLLEVMQALGPPLFVTPATDDCRVAMQWLEDFRGHGLDGVVAKRPELRYEPGVRAMLKVKHERTAECVVAGLRAAEDAPEVVALMLGLYRDDGSLEHIGVASSFAKRARHQLARDLAPLVGGLEGHPWEHGFLRSGGAMGRLKGAAGRWVPGMPMDWIPVAPERVCEVSYGQVDGYRLRHPAKFVRWRSDREPASCRLEQLQVSAPSLDQLLPASR